MGKSFPHSSVYHAKQRIKQPQAINDEISRPMPTPVRAGMSIFEYFNALAALHSAIDAE